MHNSVLPRIRFTGTLPPEKEVVPTARWRELVTDPENKEFDVYSFQMAIFSVVVAVGLATASSTGLATFDVPDELLYLLGLSQAIFIGGKAVEKSPFVELDAKLTEVRLRGRRLQEAIQAAAVIEGGGGRPVRKRDHETVPGTELVTDRAGDKAARREIAESVERDAFRTELEQAAIMFWALYADQIGTKPPALQNLDAAVLEAYAR